MTNEVNKNTNTLFCLVDDNSKMLTVMSIWGLCLISGVIFGVRTTSTSSQWNQPWSDRRDDVFEVTWIKRKEIEIQSLPKNQNSKGLLLYRITYNKKKKDLSDHVPGTWGYLEHKQSILLWVQCFGYRYRAIFICKYSMERTDYQCKSSFGMFFKSHTELL